MLRKVTIAGVSILVALIGAQGTASASPVLTEEGSALAVNSSVVAVNDGQPEFLYGMSGIVCTSSELSGPLIANGGKLIKWQIESGFWHGKAPGEACIGPGTAVTITPEGLPWCLESSELGNFSIKSKKCSTEGEGERITFRFKYESFYQCLYRALAANGTYKTAPEAATLTLSKTETILTFVSGSPLCSTMVTWKGSYQLKTPGGSNLTIG
jgi:hypothetical protein